MSAPTRTPVTIPDNAAALVELAELEREEQRAWGLWLIASGQLRDLPADDPDCAAEYAEAQEWERLHYCAWAAAWEAYWRKRYGFGMEK